MHSNQNLTNNSGEIPNIAFNNQRDTISNTTPVNATFVQTNIKNMRFQPFTCDRK